MVRSRALARPASVGDTGRQNHPGVRCVMAKDRKAAGFVHLRVKSAYSLLEGAVRPKELADLARAARDAGRCGDRHQQSLRRLMKSAKRWPKPACSRSSAACCRSNSAQRAVPSPGFMRKKPPHVPLLVQNETGLSQSHKAAQRRLSRCRAGRLAACQGGNDSRAHAEGLIALTGGPGGPLNRLLVEGQDEAARRAARQVARRSSATGSMSNCSATACAKSAPPKSG